MMSVELNASRLPACLAYDRSMNIAAADIWVPSAIDAINTAKWWDLKAVKDGDFQAAIMYETGGWSLRARTTGAWGTVLGVTFSGGLLTNSAPKIEIFKDGSTYCVVVVYYDTSRNLRAMMWTASGTTLTNIVDGSGSAGQIVAAAGVHVDSLANLDIQKLSNTRGIVQYTNNSNYNTVIGVTVSATAVTEDASPAVVKTTITPTAAECYCGVYATKSNAALVIFRTTASTSFFKSLVSDSGTALSISSEAEVLPADAGADDGLLVIANSSAAVIGNDKLNLNLALINASTGDISSQLGDTDIADYAYTPIKFDGDNGNTQGIRIRAAALGAVDSDTVQWFAIPAYSQNDSIYGLFIGIDTSRSVEEFLSVVRKLATPSEAEGQSKRFAALTDRSFMVGWVEQTLDKYVYEIVNL